MNSVGDGGVHRFCFLLFSGGPSRPPAVFGDVHEYLTLISVVENDIQGLFDLSLFTVVILVHTHNMYHPP